ncbi:L-lysine exporter family protein LysE/ArgO [Ensifer adhaerens]|nr:L-lysine exporter family protein LysE/ArgO [Ensifer adhaerens]
MLSIFATGFATSLGLIVAIGAQNAFLLRQGLRREHVFVLSSICAVSDALLISAGVAGFGAAMQALTWLEPVLRYGGAAFVALYGLRSLWSAFHVEAGLNPAEAPPMPLKTAVLTCLAFTWANPHCYLDTVVFLGSISTRFAPNQWFFGAGAAVASLSFFFALGYGARLAAPLMARPAAWRALDAGIGLIMAAIAFRLITLR